MPSITGHKRLVNDLEELFLEARDFEFHDFKNQKYAAPKVALDAKLRALANNVRTGRYDNAPEDEANG